MVPAIPSDHLKLKINKPLLVLGNVQKIRVKPIHDINQFQSYGGVWGQTGTVRGAEENKVFPFFTTL